MPSFSHWISFSLFSSHECLSNHSSVRSQRPAKTSELKHDWISCNKVLNITGNKLGRLTLLSCIWEKVALDSGLLGKQDIRLLLCHSVHPSIFWTHFFLHLGPLEQSQLHSYRLPNSSVIGQWEKLGEKLCSQEEHAICTKKGHKVSSCKGQAAHWDF